MHITRLFSWGLTALALSAPLALADKPVLNINTASDINSPYALKMVQLANQHIGNKYQLNTKDDGSTKSRIMEEVENGTIDVYWASTNRSTEERLEPIRIPLYKGLLGHRIFIIRKGDQARFDQVHTLDDVKRLKLCSGTTWGDTGILEANGMNLVKVNKYPNMFYMLDGARFDAFPRAVFEPFAEVEKHPDLDLTVEKNLMLVYPLPYYIFVRKGNTQLQSDLTRGLEAALADGSFDDVFFNDPNVQDVINKVNLPNRRIFKLANPTLSKETPLDRKELWIDAKTLNAPKATPASDE